MMLVLFCQYYAALAQSKEQPKFSPAQAKALEDMSYALAINAATWGSPIVTMYALRYHDASHMGYGSSAMPPAKCTMYHGIN